MDVRSLKPAFNTGKERVDCQTTTSAMLSIPLSQVLKEVATTTKTGTVRTAPGSSMKPTDGVIPEITTTTETGTTAVRTAPGSSMKPTDGATKAVNKFPIMFLVVFFICELTVSFD
ncbi:unnamed protein product [Dicrocoelium dendriticum]|nr:unnamed protein product [Dicrocoelium dendriticum]